MKTIVEHKLPLNLSQIDGGMRVNSMRASEAEKKFTLNDEAYAEAIRDFFRERLEFYLRDVLGLAYDVVNATLAAGADDVVDAVARAQAVAESSSVERLRIDIRGIQAHEEHSAAGGRDKQEGRLTHSEFHQP